MMELHDGLARRRLPGSRIAPRIELRQTLPGDRHHVPSADHLVSMLEGPPVRISCAARLPRCVRDRGELNVMPAGLEDRWVEDDASSVVDLRIPAPLVRAAAEEMALDPDRASILPHCHLRDVRIEHIARALAAEQRASAPNGLLYRESLGLALTAHLLAHYPAPPPPRRLSAKQLAKVTDYIEAHLDEDVSLVRLAQVSGVSASHLRTLFKQAAGVPVHQYVIQRRVERARVLILRGELPASQVALEAGFSHQSHMARCMRRVLGVTPAALSGSRRRAR
jgi:AraC family transcriptional regulator